MRKQTYLILFGLLALALMMGACGGKPEVVEAPPPVVVEPEPEPEPEPPPPPPPPPPKLKESQLMTVYFDLDKFDLRDDTKESLSHNYEVLAEFDAAIIKIEGHCDERGTVEYNLSLGEKRAQAVMDYIAGMGIPASRLSIISYGKERPVDTGRNDAAWDKNRRCEFRIISQ